MKLHHYTAAYFVGIFLVIISIWAVIFYYVMLDEIYDSIDDGLDNQKGLVILKASVDSSILRNNDFAETDYAIREIPAASTVNFHDAYSDTMMYMQNEKSDEPARMLTTMFLQNGKYYRLQIVTSMVEEDDLVKQLLYSILWLCIALITIILAFNNILLKKIWHPFYLLLNQLKKFRLDKNEPVTAVKSRVDEFRMMNETVQLMLQRNIDTYNSQKHFIENAAHELQTPLAISINKLEALAENHEMPPEQLELLSSALDNLERLTRMNKSLLLLSKIENRLFTGEKAVDLNNLCLQVAEDFTDLAAYNEIKISIEEKSTCIQTLNEDLAAILLTNLIKNAIIHNHKGGFVSITIDSTHIQIENSGNAIRLDETNIFNRFQTGEPSPSNTGLGLAIAKAIAALYNFKISYSYSSNHIMRISF
jgi:signal transduction histidine kinase